MLIMSFKEFEKVYVTSKILIKASHAACELSESMDELPKELYADLCRLHNAAVDFIETYRNHVDENF